MTQFKAGTRLAEVPIFPLPRVVLFPGALLPLHIFEPRYRTMTQAALASNQLICMANIVDATRVNLLDQPEIPSVAGIGEIVDHQRLDDGRFNLLLLGRARVSLTELPFLPPYRRASVTVLGSSGSEPTADERSVLGVAIQRRVARVRANHPEFEFDYPPELPTSQIVDLCAHYLVTDAHVRQELLETLDVNLRLQRCLDSLMDQNPGPKTLN
jgi:Lon protease-like protein